MGVFYELTLRVGAGDAGPGYQCRPSSVLTFLQEAATQAACQFHGSSPEVYEKYHALWMVTRTWYRLSRPLLWNEPVTIRTWHRADQGVALYRDFDLLVNGAPVGQAVSSWVLADAASRRLLRFADVEEVAASGGGELCRSQKLNGIRLPDGMALADRRRFHFSDIDCNGHVNNVRYADLAADALHLEDVGSDRFVSSLRICYLHECQVGERLALYTGESEAGRFVHGESETGQSRFDAILTLDKLSRED